MEKISKEKCQKYLQALIADALAKGPIAVSEAVNNYLRFLSDNYKNLTPEMQTIADNIFEETLKHFNEAIKSAPDTIEMRKAKRLLKIIKKNLPSALLLITVLESPAELKDPAIAATRIFFEKYLQILLETLYDITEGGHRGIASFAKLSILFSCVNELVCAFHLAQRGYVNQALSHVRTVFEALNLVELFMIDKSSAEIWCSNNEKEKMKELSPRAVRKKLGAKNLLKHPIYQFLSSHGSHPSWDYIRGQSGKKVSSAPDDRTRISIWLGGTRFVHHLIFANNLCVLGLFQTFLSTGTAFKERVHQEDYSHFFSQFIADFKNYMEEHSIKWAKSQGFETKELEERLHELPF